jgi:hypothetical protein
LIKRYVENGRIFKDNYEAMSYLGEIKFQTNYEQAIGVLEKEIGKTKGLEDDEKEKLLTRLMNNATLKTLIR